MKALQISRRTQLLNDIMIEVKLEAYTYGSDISFKLKKR